ncbi:MAG: type II toxin-antitoxin system VapC family toxin [Chloroflexi bacterium]|nr:type II toxin-antitoxin system VapC family toxin [Chloroflexota bacterium]
MPNIPPLPKPSSPSAPESVNEKIKAYVLDSHARLALLQREVGQERVAGLIELAHKQKAALYISLINWGEIFYIVARRQNAKVAKELMQDIEKLPLALAEVNRARVQAAAEVKSKYPVSYADAFAVALAREYGALLVTGDPEFKAVEKMVSILWLGD